MFAFISEFFAGSYIKAKIRPGIEATCRHKYATWQLHECTTQKTALFGKRTPKLTLIVNASFVHLFEESVIVFVSDLSS